MGWKFRLRKKELKMQFRLIVGLLILAVSHGDNDERELKRGRFRGRGKHAGKQRDQDPPTEGNFRSAVGSFNLVNFGVDEGKNLTRTTRELPS